MKILLACAVDADRSIVDLFTINAEQYHVSCFCIHQVIVRNFALYTTTQDLTKCQYFEPSVRDTKQVVARVVPL